jgi:hypothetical protein
MNAWGAPAVRSLNAAAAEATRFAAFDEVAALRLASAVVRRAV